MWRQWGRCVHFRPHSGACGWEGAIASNTPWIRSRKKRAISSSQRCLRESGLGGNASLTAAQTLRFGQTQPTWRNGLVRLSAFRDSIALPEAARSPGRRCARLSAHRHDHRRAAAWLSRLRRGDRHRAFRPVRQISAHRRHSGAEAGNRLLARTPLRAHAWLNRRGPAHSAALRDTRGIGLGADHRNRA